MSEPRTVEPDLPPLSEACEEGFHYDCREGEDDCTCPCHEGDDDD